MTDRGEDVVTDPIPDSRPSAARGAVTNTATNETSGKATGETTNEERKGQRGCLAEEEEANKEKATISCMVLSLVSRLRNGESCF